MPRYAMKKSALVVIIALALSVVLFTVATRPKQAGLVGTYTAVSGDTSYLLELRADNTYSQRIRGENGREYTNAGRWESAQSEGKPVIEIRNFVCFEMGELKSYGLYVAPVEKGLFGRTKLWFAEWLIFSHSAPPNDEETR